MRQALKDSVVFMGAYVLVVWILLVALQAPLVFLFKAQGITAELVRFFCLISGFMWFFIGLLFVANASFNNLGFPIFSTGFKWARATLGIVPFALGAHLGGPKGAIAGVALGSVAFGVAAIVTAFWTIRKLESRTGSHGSSEGPRRPGPRPGSLLSGFRTDGGRPARRRRGSPEAVDPPARAGARPGANLAELPYYALIPDAAPSPKRGDHHDQLVRPDAAGSRGGRRVSRTSLGSSASRRSRRVRPSGRSCLPLRWACSGRR